MIKQLYGDELAQYLTEQISKMPGEVRVETEGLTFSIVQVPNGEYNIESSKRSERTYSDLWYTDQVVRRDSYYSSKTEAVRELLTNMFSRSHGTIVIRVDEWSIDCDGYNQGYVYGEWPAGKHAWILDYLPALHQYWTKGRRLGVDDGKGGLRHALVFSLAEA